MSSILASLLKEDDNSIKGILNDEGIKVNNVFVHLFDNFSQYMETKNVSFLKNELIQGKETAKEKQKSAAAPTENRRERNKVLAEITEEGELQNVKIKLERISTVSSLESGVSSIDSNDKQQSGGNFGEEDMPAPKKLPPRKRKIKTEPTEAPKRSTRTHKPVQTYEPSEEPNDSFGKPSDVAIQDTTIPIIDICSEPDEQEANKENTRSTRTKTRQKAAQALAAVDSLQIKVEPPETKPVRSTRTRTRRQKNTSTNEDKTTQDEVKSDLLSKPDLDKGDGSTNIQPNADKSLQADPNKSGHTEYEDALSSPVQQNVNTTYVKQTDAEEGKNAEKDMQAKHQNNNIVMLENKKVSESINKTDATSAVSTKIPVKAQNGTPKPLSKKTKEIFSPYEKSSTKRKVEAFEKLQNHGGDSPVSKSKARPENVKRDGSTIKNKIGTPAHSKFVPKICSTSKIDRVLHRNDASMGTDVVLSSKSHSALKASRDEFREREKRRQEKEKEALKKREALLEGLSEQKRKKREEKHLKAQIQREQLEKENLKKLEVQKVREEKYRQALAEKEEKNQKLRLEAEKKRLLVKKKAEELKEKEKEDPKLNETTTIETTDLTKLALLKQQRERDLQQQQHVSSHPIYMVTRAPLLPTADCYDSDEETGHNKPKVVAGWAKDRELNKIQYAILYAGEKIKNTFFSRQTHTPDLLQIFEYVDPRKLKRTSSAIWRKPPRYTFFAETSRVHFSEDEDDES